VLGGKVTEDPSMRCASVSTNLGLFDSIVIKGTVSCGGCTHLKTPVLRWTLVSQGKGLLALTFA
jgi:hypothetical protein